MILPFSTQLNGKPTHFVSKIWVGLEYLFSEFQYKGYKLFNFPKEYIECDNKGLLTLKKQNPKIHTFREDKKNRWKPGMMIDFFINTRTKDMFRFAPRIPVVSTQKVQIIYKTAKIEIYIDYKLYSRYCLRERKEDNKLLVLANNDGFDMVEDFFAYFNTNFSGKIIHWTDLKY